MRITSAFFLVALVAFYTSCTRDSIAERPGENHAKNEERPSGEPVFADIYFTLYEGSIAERTHLKALLHDARVQWECYVIGSVRPPHQTAVRSTDTSKGAGPAREFMIAPDPKATVGPRIAASQSFKPAGEFSSLLMPLPATQKIRLFGTVYTRSGAVYIYVDRIDFLENASDPKSENADQPVR